MIDVERVSGSISFAVETQAFTVQANDQGGYDVTEVSSTRALSVSTATFDVILPQFMLDALDSSTSGILTLAGEALTLAGEPITIGV